MQLKDYYKTLRVSPSASAQQIKQSFRKLALLYHPDSNAGSATAAASFREVREAYDVLSDPAKREDYNYRRWWSRTVKGKFTGEALTAAGLLNECIRLHHYLNSINALRVDFDSLSYHIRQLLTNERIGILKEAADPSVDAGIIHHISACASLLPLKYTGPIADRLFAVAGNDQALRDQVDLFCLQQKQQHSWQRYRLVLVAVITLLICLLIYWLSR